MMPPKEIPSELLAGFTMDGQIPVHYVYRDDTGACTGNHGIANCDIWLDYARHRRSAYYGETDQWLFQALDKYLSDKSDVLIFGSQHPYYEAVCDCYGIQDIVVSEYQDVACEVAKYHYVKPDDLERSGRRFKNLVSISSFEHDGLGRYGDPINPDGDLEAMKLARNYVAEDGYLFLAVPVGADSMIFNLHRIYGRLRLPKLLEGWQLIESLGGLECYFDLPQVASEQPVLVLKRVD